MKNILVVVAHPDDEVLGCGGTVAKLSKQGNAVYTAILGEGVTSRDNKRDKEKRKSELVTLREHAKKANKLLGVKKTFIFDFPDNRFDTVALLDIVKTLEKVKKEVKPEKIFTHHRGDLNIDHRITCEAVMVASRPTKGELLKEIYSFETPSSTEWAFGRLGYVFNPNVFVDISTHLKIKQKAMELYKSEIRDYPHPRSLEAIKISAQKWGTVVGKKAAEAFELVRMSL